MGHYQSDDNEGYSDSWDHDTVRQTSTPPLPDSRTPGGYGELRFGSSHTGQFVTLLVDGSVRGLSYSIDLSVFSALGTSSGGETVSVP